MSLPRTPQLLGEGTTMTQFLTVTEEDTVTGQVCKTIVNTNWIQNVTPRPDGTALLLMDTTYIEKSEISCKDNFTTISQLLTGFSG
jgi:hypothetical protein